MTIKSLIDKVKEEKPNTFTDTKLLSIVNEIEADVEDQLYEEFVPYEHVDETELRVPAPYDRLYVSYLKAQIDYVLEEYASYQNNAAQHTQDFRDFIDWVVRTGQDVESTLPHKVRNIL